jgi:hypothetical protein
MAKRSRVELFEQIRKVRVREGVSIRELARRFRVHRRTVRQALSSAVPPVRKKPPPRPSVLEPWKPLIVGWPEADRTAPRKQRHTARRVWQRLVDEHSVEVGESTVRRFVAEVRARMEVPLAEVMVPTGAPQSIQSRCFFPTANCPNPLRSVAWTDHRRRSWAARRPAAAAGRTVRPAWCRPRTDRWGCTPARCPTPRA